MFAQVMLCTLVATVLADETQPSNGVQADPVSVEKTSAEKFKLIAIEKAIVEQTNAQRARYGLPALKVDVKLMKSSRKHTIWMARNRSLQHSHGVAENIAMGYSSAPNVLRGWMNSSGHRANILNRSYRSLGVAAYQSSGGTIYWCQQFSFSAPREPQKAVD